MKSNHSRAKYVLVFLGIFAMAFSRQMTSVSASASEAYIGKIPITLKHDVHGNDARWAKIYAAEKYGAKYEVIDPDQDLNKEIAAAETFISKGVDGIILHPITEDGVNEIIREIRDAGIYVMTYNVEASGKKVPSLLIDEAEVAAQMGTDMCKKWIELYPDKPVKIGLVSWTNIAFCFDNRTGPFLKGAKTVVDYLPTDDWGFKNSKGENLTGATYWEHAGGVLEKAIQVTSDAIIKHPDVNIIYGDNVSNGLGVAAAYEAAGRGKAVDGVPQTEIIASTDASDGELKKIADPTSSLKYCLGMQPQTFAYAQIDMMMELIQGKLDPDTYVVRYTPDTYFNYYKDGIKTMQDWYNTQYLPDVPLELAGR
ncbi:MAG: sugar ABC transporter substrate-binding protein [Synergistaceae bacterium]|jgi:ribose transport system substrate-binding protein|nr:sugar ABC transporter substrate-binding protein [Synergistaceae bacterium]